MCVRACDYTICPLFYNCIIIEIRALPDIMSGPEVRQIFKVRAVQKPDVFLSGPRTINRTKAMEKKSKKFGKKKIKFFFKKFISRFFLVYFWNQICVQWPYLMRIDNPYLVGKMLKNISPDTVRSGRTCPGNFECPVLSGQETHMPSPVEP